MKKIVLASSLFLALGQVTYAKHVNIESATLVAKNFMSSHIGNNLANPVLKTTLKYSNTNLSTLYIFENEKKDAFVIVSADDRVQPVLGYSTENKFSENSNAPISPEVRYWLNTYSSQIGAIVFQNATADEKVSASWKSLLTSSITAGPTPLSTPVAPMLTTKWNQMPYYNVFCPPNTPTGCVATAMAQIMKFWNHPLQGQGQHSYVDSVGGSLSANFGTTTYDWANMPNQLTSTSTPAETNAIGTLMSHCGIAVEMAYDPSGSGAQVISYGYNNLPSSENAMKHYFGFKNIIKGYQREQFTDTTWHNLLKFEIDNGRPLLYAGFGSVGGHAFVFDGYDQSEMFHINWGWGGMSNGYFEVNMLNPSALGVGAGSGNFNFGQQVLVNIQPASNTLPANPYTPDAVTIYDINLVEVQNPSPMSAEVAPHDPYNVTSYMKNIGSADAQNIELYAFAIDTSYINGNNNGSQLIQLTNTTQSIPVNGTYDFTASVSSMLLPEGAYYILFLYTTSINSGQFGIVVDSITDEPTLPLLVVKTPNSISNVEGSENITIAPNPANSYININAEKFDGDIMGYRITNLLGQTIINQSLSNHQTLIRIATPSLAAGNYIIHIQTNKGIIARKIAILK